MTVDNFSPRTTIQKGPVRSAGGVVASQHGHASRLGVEMLARGGNAVDAAIATAFALGVLEPWMSGIGGGGLMVVHRPDAQGQAGETSVYDFNMMAPRNLDPARYPVVSATGSGMYGWPAVEADRNSRGAEAVSVPGMVAGLGVAHARHGVLDWRDLLDPAVGLARQGLAMDWYANLMIGANARDLVADPGCREMFLPDGMPPGIPDSPTQEIRLAMPQLADTLATLRDHGPQSFYAGPLAERIAAGIGAAGGCLELADLAGYEVRQPVPLEIQHGQAVIWAVPGLSAGPTLAETLRSVAADADSGLIPDSRFYANMARSLQAAFNHRLAHLGDRPDPADPSCTTHISVIDKNGMIVSLTQTLVAQFGSKLLLPDTGILLNNGISWFDPVAGRPNSLAPGKRGLTNMCPIIGRRRDGLFFALGASGGRRILAAVAQVTAFLTDYRLDLEESLRQPRIDVSGTDQVLADPKLGETILEELEQSFNVVPKSRMVSPSWYANVCAASRHRDINFACAEPVLPWADAAGETD